MMTAASLPHWARRSTGRSPRRDPLQEANGREAKPVATLHDLNLRLLREHDRHAIERAIDNAKRSAWDRRFRTDWYRCRFSGGVQGARRTDVWRQRALRSGRASPPVER